MPEIKVTADIDVWCGKCGNAMCRETKVDDDSFRVNPCPTCMDEQHKDSYDEGYEKGYEDGKNDKGKKK